MNQLHRLALVAALFTFGTAALAQDAPAEAPQAAPDAVLTEPSYDPTAPVAPVEKATLRTAPAVARKPVPVANVAQAPQDLAVPADRAIAPAPQPQPAPVADPIAPTADPTAPAPSRAERVEPVDPVTP